MMLELNSPCVADTSVLVNFLRLDRLDLLGEQPARSFLITPHIDAEVAEHYSDQRTRLQGALSNGWVKGARLVEPPEVLLFSKLLRRGLGPGGAAAVAVAVCRHWALASDSSVIHKRAHELDPEIAIVTTKTILLEAIITGLITIAEADEIKGRLHSYHKFQMRGFSSFSELLN